MPAMGRHVVETHEFDLDGVWLSPSPVAIVLLSDCFEEGLGTDVINDGAIAQYETAIQAKLSGRAAAGESNHTSP